FIANRIGAFVTLNVLRIMQQDSYSIEEIDALTGPAMGLPKSATFRTLDLVGLDVLAHVVKNLREALPEDERRDLFEVPSFVVQMRERKLLGEKTGQGFYKKVAPVPHAAPARAPASQGAAEGDRSQESEILTLDLDTFQYRERQKARFGSLDMARNI